MVLLSFDFVSLIGFYLEVFPSLIGSIVDAD